MSMLRHFVHGSFTKKNSIACGLTLLCLLISSCDWSLTSQEGKNGTREKRDENVITFVTINSPNTYYINSDREFSGLEYDLAVAFVDFLEDKKQIEFIVVDSIQEVVEALINDQADIAAADLTLTQSRRQLIDFSIPYQNVQQQVIYNNQITSKPAKNIRELVGKEIVVPASSSFVERLNAYQKLQPDLAWIVRESSHSENMLEDVAEGNLEYTIADDHLVSVLQNFYPQLDVAFTFGKPEKIAWGFAKGRKPELLLEANAFFTKIKSDGTLRNLIDRYHGNSKRLKPLDVDTFLKRTRSILPQYKKLFKDAQEITGIDWRMLAALSYQESHWNTFNTSPTNVRGLMMLTEATSDQMGVMNRLDPKESIPAGAKYLNLMINTLPERIPEPDRTYMALAAYNIGYAHVEDARVLAQRLGLNPDSWVDVKKALVKLNNPEHYANAKYGYCRCAQPVIYVESIRSYYNILSRFEPAHEPFENDPYKIASN
jgi:membrane-bound lytic murein transglycosylase F